MIEDIKTALDRLKTRENRLVADLAIAEQKANDIRQQLFGLRHAISIVEGTEQPVTRAIKSECA